MEDACLFSRSRGIRVVWGVYGNCTLNCGHCAVAMEDYRNPEIGKYGKVLEGMGLSGVDNIYISGGEPLLWKDVFGFVEKAGENGIFTTLGTNGTCLGGSAEKLREAGIGKVFISLDSHEEDVHDYLRGPGVFRKAMGGLGELKEWGIPARADCIIWKRNYRKLDEFVDFCERKGFEEIAFAWPVDIGKIGSDILPPRGEYFEIGSKLESLRKESGIKISYHRFGRFGKECGDCPGGEKIFYLDWRGRLSPCFWLSSLDPGRFSTEESVFEEDFSDLKKSGRIHRLLSDKAERRSEFGPGCPAMCIAHNGEFRSRDPCLSQVL